MHNKSLLKCFDSVEPKGFSMISLMNRKDSSRRSALLRMTIAHPCYNLKNIIRTQEIRIMIPYNCIQKVFIRFRYFRGYQRAD